MASRFTKLETSVLDALAWDLRETAPDLAGQVEESLPGLRRNTGAGYYAEVIVDRRRPLPDLRPTGLFGTVHAMVGDLPEPVAFKAELREGRLLALHADSYGQDTRAIDFARVRFDEVFTVDETGESILFEPAALMPESPLLDLHLHPDIEPIQSPPTPRESPLRVMQRSDERPAEPAPPNFKALLDGPPPSPKAVLITWIITGGLFIAGLYFAVGGDFDLLSFVPVIGAVSLFRVPKLRLALARYIDTLLKRHAQSQTQRPR